MDSKEQGIASALAQTGFPFEHHVYREAAKNGWTTISNRLYIDREEEKTREMDLLCYRVDKGSAITTYTGIIISCKARSAKSWVLMTRPWPRQIATWYAYPPVQVWTNSAALKHELKPARWGEDYFQRADDYGLKEWAADSPGEVFALQEFELSKERFNAKGDSGMYAGVMSLLKSLHFEIGALDERRGPERDAYLYHFNLIQVLDGELFEASFATGSPEVRRIDRYRYFARTMLNGREFSARIDFCTREKLPQLLDSLTRVHSFNIEYFTQKHEDFYKNLLYDPARLDSLRHTLEKSIGSFACHCAPELHSEAPGWCDVKFNEAENKFSILLDSFEVVEKLNRNKMFLMVAASAVKRIYRFEGTIEVSENIPF